MATATKLQPSSVRFLAITRQCIDTIYASTDTWLGFNHTYSYIKAMQIELVKTIKTGKIPSGELKPVKR